MTKIINIELDLDQLFKDKDKVAALTKAVESNWGAFASLREILCQVIIEKCDLKELQYYIDCNIVEEFKNTEALRSRIKMYTCSSHLDALIRQSMDKHIEIIDKLVSEYLITNNFAKNIGGLIESTISQKFIDLLGGSKDEDN